MSLQPKPRRRGAFLGKWLCTVLSASWLTGAAAAAPDAADATATGTPTPPLQEVTITAQRLELLGEAVSASEGVVTDEELQLTPSCRSRQLLETVPGAARIGRDRAVGTLLLGPKAN